MLDDYRDVTRDQRSAVDRVSVSVKSSKSGFFDHHRHAINFQEQGNGCHLMKMMSTIRFLFFYSEANVRTIWYLFVAFACRNWEFLPSSIWTIIFLQKQLIWYDVKNWNHKPIIKIYVVYVNEISRLYQCKMGYTWYERL